jgi:drug/metabolite transporter (DMT)-like permease
LGALAAIAAALTWAIASLYFARAGQRIGPGPLNLAKCALGVAMLVASYAVLEGRGWPTGLDPTSFAWLAASALVGLTWGDTAFFEALNRLGPRRALLFWALVPPLTALLAVPSLGEPLTVRMMVGIAVTMAGVGWVVFERSERERGGSAPPWAGLGFGLGAAWGQALGNILLKKGGAELSALEVAIVRLGVGTAGIVVHLALSRQLNQMRRFLEPGLASPTVVGTVIGTYLGIWLSVYALQHTYAGVAATLISTSPIFVLPLAALVLGERISLRAVLGALLAVGGVAFLLL